MSDAKSRVTGEDWTELLTHPEVVRNFDLLFETYRKAPPEKREQALFDALKKIKSRRMGGDNDIHAASTSIARGIPAPPFEPAASHAIDPQERRGSPRIKCAVAVELWSEGATVPFWGNVANTALGGCFVETTAPLRGGEKLEIGLWVANGTLWIKGIVLNGIVTETKPRLGVRVKFTDLEPEERENLREFLRLIDRATAGHKAEHGYLAQLKRGR